MENKNSTFCNYCYNEYGTFWKNNRGVLLERVRTKDHIVPLIRGGVNSKENLIECCNRCNSFKGNLLLSEWRDLISKGLANKDTEHGVVKIKGEPNLLIHYKIKDLTTILNSLNKMLNS